jgi:hypothetical protein
MSVFELLHKIKQTFELNKRLIGFIYYCLLQKNLPLTRAARDGLEVVERRCEGGWPGRPGPAGVLKRRPGGIGLPVGL